MNNLKIGQRLALGFGMVLILLSLIALIGITRVASINANVESMANDRYPKAAASQEIALLTMDNARIVRNLILLDDPAKKEANLNTRKENLAKLNELYQMLENTTRTEEGKALLRDVKAARDSFRAYTDEVVALALDPTKKEAAAGLLFGEKYATQTAYFKAIKVLTDFQARKMNALRKDAAESFQSTSATMIGLSIGALLLGVIIAYFATRSITKPIAEALRAVQQISGGDLTAVIQSKSNDETGQLLAALSTMIAKLQGMIGDVLRGANQVSTTACELSASSAQVAESSRHQAEATSSMAAAVEELTVSIDQVSVNTNEVKATSAYSGELSQQGALVIQDAVLEMGKIDKSVKESAQIIKDLEQQSAQISNIVNVIKEIADQTNLLALNAAIEAARAGESGRGFAVVADEVRKLAERTSKSTQEIAGMISKIQDGTRQAVTSMESGVDCVSSGVSLANQAGSSITQIKAEAASVARGVGVISESLKEQIVTSGHIAKNVEKIAQMTEENSAAVRQTAGAAQDLEQLASSLQRAISQFKV